MTKLLSTTAMLLALSAAANATDLICSAPRIAVGQQSKSQADTVDRIEIRHATGNPEWQVHHRFQNGTMVLREEQYTMQDASNSNVWQWRGRLNKDPSQYMVGELRQDSQGRPYYSETLYFNGTVKMQSSSWCNVQTAALTPPTAAPGPYRPLQKTEAQAEAERQADEARKQAAIQAEQDRIRDEEAKKQAEIKAEQDRKQAEWKAEQDRKQAEWKAEQDRKYGEWKAEQERKQAEWAAQHPQSLQPVTVEPKATDPAKAEPVAIKREVVPLKIVNNTVMINVGLGDQVVTMVLDTGATSSQVTGTMAANLVRDGQARWDGTARYRMADGSIGTARVIVIYEVKIGSHVVRNVTASVVNSDTEMLLGYDVVKTLGPTMIDHENKQLTFAIRG
jgi:hypothetical protein